MVSASTIAAIVGLLIALPPSTQQDLSPRARDIRWLAIGSGRPRGAGELLERDWGPLTYPYSTVPSAPQQELGFSESHGRFSWRLHIGLRHRIREPLAAVVMMKYSPDWKVFMDRLDRAFPQWGKSYLCLSLMIRTASIDSQHERGRQLRRPQRKNCFYLESAAATGSPFRPGGPAGPSAQRVPKDLEVR
jgi:hypothetical protein